MSNVLEREPIRPAHLWVPSGATFEAGAEAADLAKQLGFQVDWEEQQALNVLLSLGANGKWAGLETAVICSRQNLKTWALEMTALYDLFIRDIKAVTWSAHLYKTTQSTFNDMTQIIENTDWLRKKVKKITQANGDEGFEMISGAKMRFLARTKSGGRGLTGDTVILDEALLLNPTMMGALIPTLSSRPNPHIRFGSSAGLIESNVLRSIRKRGRANDDPSLSYIEWASVREICPEPMCSHKPGEPGCILDVESKWAEANPALHRRISIDYVRNERRSLPASEFMRERMGWWEDPLSEDKRQPIPAEAWEKCTTPKPEIAIGTRVAFAVDTSWDRQSSWIAICATNQDGLPHIEIAEQQFGTEWVIPWLKERVRTWNPVGIAYQEHGSPVSSLAEKLKEEFGDLMFPISGSELAKACGDLHDQVVEGSITHWGQPHLNDAMKYAETRTLGDAWIWDRKGSAVDIAPLVAVTEALWAWSSPRNTISIYETRDLLII